MEIFMDNKEEFEFLSDQLLENAISEFKKTKQHKLLREKLNRTEQDCDAMFTADEKEFAAECFELITDVNGQEEYFVYRQGMLDCVKLLKWFGVLA